MPELETQVAKIQIGDPKQATAYVYLMAEKIDATETEIYVLCELPLFNPAAQADCERIAEAIGASLKRSYRKTATDATFENSLAQINEELGKLASLGKTHWIGKLNALVAAKRGETLSIATVGKITALLYRDGLFTTVSESAGAPTPLKTFENFAIGKLRLGDLLIFSTTQLLNHISIDRIRQILEGGDLPQAAGAIIEILRENAGPEVACGAILALQVSPGQGRDEEIDLAPYVAGAAGDPVVESAAAGGLAAGDGFAGKAKNLSGKALRMAQGFVGRTLPQAISRIRNQPRPDVRQILNKNKAAIGVVNQQFRRATQQFRPETFRGFSNQKKFFFISAAILLAALIASVSITQHYHKTQVAATTAKSDIEQMQKLAGDANANLLYGDEGKARDLLNQLNSQLNGKSSSDKTVQGQLDDLRKQAADLAGKLNKESSPQASTVATLSGANRLIVLPGYLATETNRVIVSYNRATGQTQDNVLKSSEPINYSVATKGSNAVIYNGKELFLWNFQTGLFSSHFSENVPTGDSMVGLRIYPTNSRVYTIDKANNRVLSFLAGDKDISKPVVAIANAGDLSQASDLAIDGNIYLINNGTVLKFNSGAKQDFTPSLPSGLASGAKIYTQSDFANLYILDGGNKRIIILNKKGGLVGTLNLPQLSNMKDFTVEEKGKTIFILNNDALMKINF